MARVLIPLVITSPGSGGAIGGATVVITRHYDSSNPNTYPDSVNASNGTGATGLTTDTGGRVVRGGNPVWIDTGTYDFAISGAGLTGITLTRELVSAVIDDVSANGSLRTLGTASTQAMAGNDARVVGAAPLASPTFTGSPAAPTVGGTSDSSTKLATTAFVQNVVAALTDPGLVPVAKTTNYTAVSGDLVIATSGTFTVTLPSVAVNEQLVAVINIGSGVVTVTHGDASTIYGPGLATGSLLLRNVGEYVVLGSDGTRWLVRGSSLGGLTYSGLAGVLQIVPFSDAPFLGAANGANNSYTPSPSPSIAFANACIGVATGNVGFFSDSGHNTIVNPGGAWISYRPSGTGIAGSYFTGSGNLWCLVNGIAFGY